MRVPLRLRSPTAFEFLIRNQLAKRAQELIEDKNGLQFVQLLPGMALFQSVMGHQMIFKDLQVYLRNYLMGWDTRNCDDQGGGGLPGDAWSYATMPVPSPAPQSQSGSTRVISYAVAASAMLVGQVAIAVANEIGQDAG